MPGREVRVENERESASLHTACKAAFLLHGVFYFPTCKASLDIHNFSDKKCMIRISKSLFSETRVPGHVTSLRNKTEKARLLSSSDYMD